MREIITGLLPFIAAAIVIFVGVFVIKLIQAPIHMRYEKEKEPQLVIGEPKSSWLGIRTGRSFRLSVKNASFGKAENCRGKLIAIASTIYDMDKGLDLWPPNEYLNWNTGEESISIAPNDTMELEIANYEGWGSPLRLAYAKGEAFRKQHELKGFTRPIILIISITCETKPPIYAICQFDWASRTDNNLKLIEVKPTIPDIKQYQTQVFDNGDSQL